MAAAADAVDHQRIPGVERCARRPETRRQQAADRQVGGGEGELEQQRLLGHGGMQPEQQLRQRRIDGGGAGMVDLRPPGRAQGLQRRGIRRQGVGAEPLQLDPPLPEVAPDVVAGLHAQQRQPREHGHCPEQCPGQRGQRPGQGKARPHHRCRQPERTQVGEVKQIAVGAHHQRPADQQQGAGGLAQPRRQLESQCHRRSHSRPRVERITLPARTLAPQRPEIFESPARRGRWEMGISPMRRPSSIARTCISSVQP